MLKTILKKLGVASLKEFFDNEAKIEEKYKGLEIERITPLSKLTYEELEFLDDYLMKHRGLVLH